MRRSILILLSLSLALILGSTGCAYLKMRGNDALDVFDVGISVNDKWSPDFALYINPFEVAPLGYSRIEGKFLGIGNRQVGWLDHEERCWAIIECGKEKKGTGEFNPRDPHQAREDQRELTERASYNVGIWRMIKEDNSPPTSQFLECDKCCHFGWIGIRANCRVGDLVDFILGWTTLDIMGDDHVSKPEPFKEQAK